VALFTVGGHEYRSDNLDAIGQFNVARRLTPVVFALAPLISLGATTEELAAVITSDIGANLELLRPTVEAVAKMSDADVDYIIANVASKVYRGIRNPVSGQIDSWIPIWNAHARAFQYQDIGLPELVQIVWRVLQENLSSFSFGSPSTSSEPPRAQ
jgi:hypothetical protein